jgi:D-serine deaminase-like pyridoxal phosphate-dependent protein
MSLREKVTVDSEGNSPRLWNQEVIMNADWYRIANVAEIASPALLVYPDRVEENTRRMVAMAGSADRLRPHVKTHKLAEVVRLQGQHGITKFKCATIAEAEMTAAAGAPDVLIAYPLIGPNILRFIELIRTFPATQFRAIGDDADAIRGLSAAAVEFLPGRSIDVLLDIDCGMHRTGVAPGPAAESLYRLIASLPGLVPGGLHVYDGHIVDSDVAVRRRRVEEAFAPVRAFRDALLQTGLPAPRLLASSTPTFPIHAQQPDVECTPGTSAFWDWGYQVKCPDLDFLHAALVLTRVVSRPGENRLCLDLGHKAIAAENPLPQRVHLLDLPDAVMVGQSEEHLVVETPRAAEFAVGTPLYGIPWHICPTVALYAEAVTVTEGHAAGRWQIAARARKLTT